MKFASWKHAIGRKHQDFISTVAAAIVALQWIGPIWTACAVAAAFLWADLATPFLLKHVVAANAERRPVAADAFGIGMIAIGAVALNASWIAAWWVGGASFALLGIAFACVNLGFAALYLHPARLVFCSHASVILIVTALLLLRAPPQDVALWMALVAIASAALAAGLAHNDHNTLLRRSIEERVLREASDRDRAAKTQFIANMSHELRTPLNAIIGYTELMVEDAEIEGRTNAVADHERILAAARRLLGLVDDVLDISKLDAGEMNVETEDFEAESLLMDIAFAARKAIETNSNRLEVQIEPNIGICHADRSKIGRCVRVFLSNAAKFTNNGLVTLQARCEPIDGKRWLTIEVSDTGVGISPDQVSRIFEPFQQADGSTTRPAEGAGLGLVIASRLSQLLGGDIEVRSACGEGSVFRLRVPSAVADQEAQQVVLSGAGR